VGYRIVITGTDTGIGKTVFSAGLARPLWARASSAAFPVESFYALGSPK